MLALGVWQLERREWKEALIARYERAGTMSSAAVWPRSLEERERALFRHTQVLCDRVLSQGAIAGRNLAGETGWAQTARCALDGGGEADIALGWSRDPAVRRWSGGEALGVVAPGAGDAVRLIAAPPLAGLAPLARPDPRDVPNNHLAYAVQWFLFAAIAAVIYALALRKRLAAGDPRS
jgi:surfeit locus 1 family protein